MPSRADILRAKEADAAALPMVLAYLDVVLKSQNVVHVQAMAAELCIPWRQLQRIVAGYTQARPLITPHGRKVYYERSHGSAYPSKIAQCGWVENKA